MSDNVRLGREVPWFSCFTSVWGSDLDSESQHIYINLTSHAGRNMRAWPSYETIARETKLSRRCVVERIKKLIFKNLVVKMPRYRKNGSQTSNMYLVFPIHDPFDPSRERIDQDGNITTISCSAPDAPQDIVVHSMHRGGAQHAPKHNNFNNTVVVVEESSKQQQLDKQSEQAKQQPKTEQPIAAKVVQDRPVKLKQEQIDKAELAKIIVEKMKTIGIAVRPDDALDIVFDNEYTETFINQQFNYLKNNLPRINKNVVGWFRVNLRQEYKDQLSVQVEKEQSKATSKSKKNKTKKKQSKNLNLTSKEERKNLIQSLYLS